MTESKRSRSRLQIWLVLLVLLVAGGVAAWLVLSGEGPAREPESRPGTLVSTQRVERSSYRLVVDAQGTVVPDRQVQLRAQVSGRIEEVAENLEPGRRVAAGEVLVRIDPRDYQIAVDRAKAAVSQARADLALELGRQEIAEQEWEFFRERASEEGIEEASRDLALREPQLAAAQARLDRALADLEQAELRLDRTVVEAPFDAIVRSRRAAPGQLVDPQQPLATLVASEAFWVRAAVPMEQLDLVRLPGQAGGEGSPATVRLDLGDRMPSWEGWVTELLPGLDPQGRMARLLIAVPDPFPAPEGGADPARDLPLLLDAYVEVEIAGDDVRDLIPVPREALHYGRDVYVYDEGQLRIVAPEIVWSREDAVLVGKGLRSGSEVIISALPAPVEGMPLRVQRASRGRPAVEDAGRATSDPGRAREAEEDAD